MFLLLHWEGRLCVPVTHTRIKSHISSEAFKWGDNILAYYSRIAFKKKRSYDYLLIQNNILFNASKKHSQNYKRDLFLSKGSKIYTEGNTHSLNFHYSGDDTRNNSRESSF